MLKNVNPGIEMIIAMDIVMTTSVQYADIGLPASSWVEALRRAISNHGGRQQIVPKIETTSAVEFMDEIIAGCDAVLVARGDLGVEMDLARVPLLQKDLTARSRLSAKPVIIATEMLRP